MHACQKLQELQSSLTAKFQSMNTPTISIHFRLPNGQRLQQSFHENIAMRVNENTYI